MGARAISCTATSGSVAHWPPGSVRWARLLPGLRELPVADEQLGEQWRLLLDILDRQGDLGMTRANSELIWAWARYLEATGRPIPKWLRGRST